MADKLLDTQALQNELSNSISQAKIEVVIISAYITDTAISWILKEIPINVKVCVIARLAPQDMASGASTFKAIQELLDNQHEIRLLNNLHAKIYLIDNKNILIGSANLTNNGLKLFGKGNIEASIKTTVTPEMIEFINNVRIKSIEITSDILEKMKNEIKVNKSQNELLQWGDETIKLASDLWTIDMLQEEITNSNIANQDDRILLFGNTKTNQQDINSCFKQTKIYKWLVEQLKQESKGLSFGKISEKLHNDINDSPSPYRKTIKQYVKNLLSYCKLFALDEIEISRPNYSEIIKVITK